MPAKNEAKPAIRLSHLTKTYKQSRKEPVTAVNDVSLEVPQGIIFGLLGPNGAGKSTTIAVICTLLRPTKGHVELYGVPTSKDIEKARRTLGLVFQETTLDEELTARENLRFQVMLYKLDRKEERVQQALKLVGLEHVGDDAAKTFSGGMKRRLEIARALLVEPKILLLDEPTLGLDAASRREIWSYINNLIKQQNLTVLLTTHYMEEAERLCNLVAIMDHGKIVAQGTPEELIAAVAADSVTITVQRRDAKLAAKLRKVPGVQAVTEEGTELTITVKEANKQLPQLLAVVGENFTRVEMKKPTLEDAYLHYTGKQFENGGKA